MDHTLGNIGGLAVLSIQFLWNFSPFAVGILAFLAFAGVVELIAKRRKKE